jgi:hypothetical protein
MSDQPSAGQPDESEPAEPLNRAARRAQRRGKSILPPGSQERSGPRVGPGQVAAQRRRAGRRGNR